MSRVVRSLLVAIAVIALGGCSFAVKHPAITAGIVGGSVGLGSCELAASDHKACAMVGGGAGIGLALITAAALWLGYEDADPTAPPGNDPAKVEDPTNLPPAPVFVPPAGKPDEKPEQKPDQKPAPPPDQPPPAPPTPPSSAGGPPDAGPPAAPP